MQRTRSAQNDADVTWHYRFRQKWRREQLRALVDGPDCSPSSNGPPPADDGGDDGDEGLMFGLDDVAEPPADDVSEPRLPLSTSQPQSQASLLSSKLAPAPPAPAAPRALRLRTVKVSAGSDSDSDVATPTPMARPPSAAAPQPLAPLKIAVPPQRQQQPVGEVLAAELPELPAIRKVVMRGGGKPQHGKFKTPDRKWQPRMTSPQRAANAA